MTAGSSRVLHRLVIPRPRANAVLVDGSRLPTLVLEDRHTADVEGINAAVYARWRLTTRVLQSLSHSVPVGDSLERAHELELVDAALPDGCALRWSDGLDECSDRGDRAAIERWQARSAREHLVIDGRDWTRPGWFDEAVDWIALKLRDAGYGAPRSVVQLRVWPSSSVLRVCAERGDCYFKAVPQSLRRECSVTAYLSGNFPDVLPRVLATNLERRWFLTAALTGKPLDAVADTTLCERAAAWYGRMQVDCVARVPELLALGCGVRSLETLANAIGPFLEGPELAGGEGAERLCAAERDRLLALAPALRGRCEQLAACRIPSSLEHGDLWPANVLVDQNSCGIIDWEDVAVAHPFFSLAPLHVGLAPVTAAADLERIERAYLESFREFGTPVQLTDALRLAAPLSFIDMAMRYRRQRPSVASQHPWMRDLVAEVLRRALALVAEGGVLSSP